MRLYQQIIRVSPIESLVFDEHFLCLLPCLLAFLLLCVSSAFSGRRAMVTYAVVCASLLRFSSASSTFLSDITMGENGQRTGREACYGATWWSVGCVGEGQKESRRAVLLCGLSVVRVLLSTRRV